MDNQVENEAVTYFISIPVGVMRIDLKQRGTS